MKIKIINLLLLLPLITSCSNNIDEYISAGLSIYSGNCLPTSRVAIALKAKRVQPLDSTFEIYVGAIKGFSEAWKNDEFECNPGYGTFAINRVIFKNKYKTISESYTMLYDFPNDDKYPMKIEVIQSNPYRYRKTFSTYIPFTYDFSLLELDEGIIAYYICYYDDINNKEFETNVYKYGIDNGQCFRFKKNSENNNITFSEY